MRGHDALIAMRRNGMRPRMARIEAGTDHSTCTTDWPAMTPDTAHIEVRDDEPLSGLDLRCVVGMPVLICGFNPRRVAAIRELCIQAEARRVVAAVYDGDITDTETA